MKRNRQTAQKDRNFDSFMTKLSDKEILDIRGMKNIRGGEGDIVPPIIMPPPVKP